MLNVSAPGNFEEGMPVSRSGSSTVLPPTRASDPPCGVTRWNGSALALFVNSCASQ